MRRRRKGDRPEPSDLAVAVEEILRPPFAVALGSPREAADVVESLPEGEVVCWQLDLYQAGRLREELAARSLTADVSVLPDLWDLPAPAQTVLYPAPERGERELKLDVVEQSFHALKPGGRFVVLSPYPQDHFFPGALKKVYGKVHAPAAGEGMVFWAAREGDRPRRRHEVTFQVSRGEEGPSLRFLSRPGTFSYGRFDNGARALVEAAEVRPGDRVLDVGCGCGTNGVHAGLRAGPEGWVSFVDSNVRAVALAEHNARANGLQRFEAVASADVSGLSAEGFNVALTNPPYYGEGSIARLFAERARALLRPGGRFYLVTKWPDQIGPAVAEQFGRADVEERRGYVILSAQVGP